MDKKYKPIICCLQDFHFKHKDSGRLKLKGSRKMCHVNQMKARIAGEIPELS